MTINYKLGQTCRMQLWPYIKYYGGIHPEICQVSQSEQ